jgi:hypothetical protein
MKNINLVITLQTYASRLIYFFITSKHSTYVIAFMDGDIPPRALTSCGVVLIYLHLYIKTDYVQLF